MLSEFTRLTRTLETFDRDGVWKEMKPNMDKAPLIVFAFDEAHTLTPMAGRKGELYQPSHIFGRVISSFSHCKFHAPIWALFASTNSHISHYAAPNEMRAFRYLHPVIDYNIFLDASLRVVRGKKLYPPFVAFGLDQFAQPLSSYEPSANDERKKPDNDDIRKQSDIYVTKPSERASVISFGRPLYVNCTTCSIVLR